MEVATLRALLNNYMGGGTDVDIDDVLKRVQASMSQSIRARSGKHLADDDDDEDHDDDEDEDNEDGETEDEDDADEVRH